MKNWFSPKLLCKGFCIIISSWLVFRIQYNMEILIEIFNGSLWYQTCNILFMRWVNQCLHLAANWSLSQWGANFFHLGSSHNQFLLSQQSNIRSFVNSKLDPHTSTYLDPYPLAKKNTESLHGTFHISWHGKNICTSYHIKYHGDLQKLPKKHSNIIRWCIVRWYWMYIWL